jgi:hypothetical protein
MAGTGTPILPVASHGLLLATTRLVHSYEYSRDLAVDLWQFAVDWGELQALGTTLSDMRWLLARRFAEHALETTNLHDTQREFRPLPPSSFPPRTCFTLTELGHTTFRPFAEAVRIFNPVVIAATAPIHFPLPAEDQSGPDQIRRSGTDDVVGQQQETDTQVPPGATPEVPVWDNNLRELRFEGTVVKRFRVPAANQETILSVFEEEGWPQSIADPLSPIPGNDPKRRLQATIKSLNRNQLSTRLRFHGNGNGHTVWWEAV